MQSREKVVRRDLNNPIRGSGLLKPYRLRIGSDKKPFSVILGRRRLHLSTSIPIVAISLVDLFYRSLCDIPIVYDSLALQAAYFLFRSNESRDSKLQRRYRKHTMHWFDAREISRIQRTRRGRVTRKQSVASLHEFADFRRQPARANIARYKRRGALQVSGQDEWL